MYFVFFVSLGKNQVEVNDYRESMSSSKIILVRWTV